MSIVQSYFTYSYYLIIAIAVIFGSIRFSKYDKAFRVLLILLVITICSEVLSVVLLQKAKYNARYISYHVFNTIQLLLTTLFFIYALKPYHQRRLIILAALLCPAIGLANIVFLQPIDSINSNMLMFESFAITTLCLYLIYYRLKTDKKTNVFKSPHVQIALLLLISWSSTFFFWAFIEILYDADWKYSNTIMYGHATLNILVYAGIAAVFYFYPKKQIAHANS